MIALTYLPLALVAACTLPSLATRSSELKLPFLYDWNVAFMFTVSLPLLFVFVVTDSRLVSSAVARIAKDEILIISPEKAKAVGILWKHRYKRVNIAGQLVGCILGVILAGANYVVYSKEGLGFWTVTNGFFNPAGWVFLFCIFVFYAMIPIYVFRSICTIVFLRHLVGESEISIVPFHPDRCGGLRPVGAVGLRNQYVLTIFGINLILLIVVSLLFLEVPSGLYTLIAGALAAYISLGPLVFLGPLMPFRSGMLRAKTELMGLVSRRLRVELVHIKSHLSADGVTKDDEEVLDRLRRIGEWIGKFPVWPFDAPTLRKFLAAYVFPLFGVIAYPLGKALMNFLFTKIP